MHTVHGDLFLERSFVKTALRAEAGVVDEEAQPGLREQAPGDAIDILDTCEVGDQALGGDAVRGGQLRREVLEPVVTPRDEKEIVAASRQFAREYRPESGRCPGDRSDTVWHGGSIVRSGRDRNASELARRLVPALALRPRGGAPAGPPGPGARSLRRRGLDWPRAVPYHGADT